MQEFTFDTFRDLLNSFRESGYKIIPFSSFLSENKNSQKLLILRHDVDRYPLQTLKMAGMEADQSITATYYFRIIPSVCKPDIIKEVVKLGHEIGYHYEDLSLCKGNYANSISHFKKSLQYLRQFYPVTTICMHGSPLSKWDNKRLWEKYDYRDFGLAGDTAFDINYDEVFYISDNGWGWNKTAVSVRDKVASEFNIPIRNTRHLMELIHNNNLPDKIMLNAHPDTFFEPGLRWHMNKIFIKSKNIIKRQIVKYNLIK
jgi:hypothetical protein